MTEQQKYDQFRKLHGDILVLKVSLVEELKRLVAPLISQDVTIWKRHGDSLLSTVKGLRLLAPFNLTHLAETVHGLYAEGVLRGDEMGGYFQVPFEALSVEDLLLLLHEVRELAGLPDF